MFRHINRKYQSKVLIFHTNIQKLHCNCKKKHTNCENLHRKVLKNSLNYYSSYLITVSYVIFVCVRALVVHVIVYHVSTFLSLIH